jgi:hypothetical protein
MHMVALYTVWYNYVKQHKSLKGLSPAMATGLSNTLRSMTDLAETIDAALPEPGKRSPYEKAITTPKVSSSADRSIRRFCSLSCVAHYF